MVAAPWPTTAKGVISGGISVGLLAGFVMALFTMMYAAVAGIGFLTPIRQMSAIIYGQTAMQGVAPLLVGALLHFASAMIFGLAFAAFLRYSTALVASVAGIVYALLIWVTTTFVILPLFNPLMSRTVREMPLGWFFAHVLFGITLGAAPLLVTRFSRPSTHHRAPDVRDLRAA